MDNPVTHRELESFKELMGSENSRLAEENDRQNHRLNVLEANMKEMSKISANTEKTCCEHGKYAGSPETAGRAAEDPGSKGRREVAQSDGVHRDCDIRSCSCYCFCKDRIIGGEGA